MPQGYRNNSLANNPYVGIDVDYFDRKALERQQRHDVGRENYSKFVQDVANQSYLDPDARNEYLKMQQQNFDDVITKHSGNLSSGYQDVLGAIEQSKLSPYHNLNKRHVEQAKVRQDLIGQYGAEAIDLSVMPDKLYQRDKEGKLNWIDPNAIGAKVVKADNYQKIIEDMLAQTAAHEYQTQSGITGGAGNPFYLMSRIVKGEVLSPEELMMISSDPNVQKAFLANASTAGIDNRKVAGSEDTYKDMFADTNKLAKYIYGNIQDKQRNNQSESKQFMQNIGAVKALEHANKKKEQANEYALKNMHLNDLTTIQDWGVAKVNKDKIASYKEATDKVKQTLDLKNKESKENTSNFSKLTGIPVGDLSIYKDKFGNLNKKLVGTMMKKYGKTDEEINDVLGKRDVDMVFQNHNDLNLQKYNLNREVEDANNYLSNIDKEVADEYYNSLSQSNKDELKKLGINSAKDLSDKTPELEKSSSFGQSLQNVFSKEGWKDFFKSSDKNMGTSTGLGVIDYYVDFRDKKFKEGFTPKVETVKALFNADPESIPGQFSKLNEKVVEDMGLKGYLNLLQTKNGDNYMAMNEDLKDFVDKYSAKSSSGLFGRGGPEESEYKIETKFGMAQNQVANGLNPLIKLQVKDDKGNIVDEFTVVDAKLNNDNAIAQEIKSRLTHYQDMTYSLDPNYDEIGSNNAYYVNGQSEYGEQAVKLVSDMKNPGDVKTIPFTYKDGTPSHITFEKTQYGYRSLIGTGKGNQAIEKFHMDPVKLLDLTFPGIGWSLEKLNNRNTETNYSFYPKNSDKAPTVNQNLAKDKVPQQEITE